MSTLLAIVLVIEVGAAASALLKLEGNGSCGGAGFPFTRNLLLLSDESISNFSVLMWAEPRKNEAIATINAAISTASSKRRRWRA
jgi:hypothetical protein